MSRTIGATDLYPRRSRSDLGKRRKKYGGKKVKTKRQIKFEKKKGRKTHILLRPMQEQRMSLEGWRNWKKNVRAKIRPWVYRQMQVIITPVKDIDTKKNLEEWSLAAIGKPGLFKVGGYSGAATKTRTKRVKMFDVRIMESPEGLRAKIVKDWRMFRYKWFYKDA